MRKLKALLKHRLTGPQTLVVLAVLLTAGGLGYLAYEAVVEKVLEARLRAATPKVCAGIREERAQLVAAIEAYKTQFGAYPPDHVLSRQPLVVDPVTNTLLYELAGVLYNATNKTFEVSGLEIAEADYVKQFFQIEGFKNCAESPGKTTRFLRMEPLPVQQLHDDPDVFAMGFPLLCQDIPPELVWEFRPSPWRYVSTSPTNNPGRFDVWLELEVKGHTTVIGNWPAAE